MLNGLRMTVPRYALVLFACLTVLNLSVDVIEKNNRARTLFRRSRLEPQSDIIFIGNSLIATAIDNGVCVRLGKSCVELGLGSSQLPEHAAILQEVISRGGGGDIVYGFMDMCLSEPTPDSWAGNRAVIFHLDHVDIPKEYGMTRLGRLKFHVWRSIPLLTYQDALWGKVEKLRRNIEDFSAHKTTPTNVFGRSADFSKMEYGSSERFAGRIRTIMNQTTLLAPPVVRMLRDTNRAGRRLRFVLMPMTKAHRVAYYETPAWQAYFDRLRVELEAYGARVESLDDTALDSDFMDAVHLGKTGATRFTQRVLSENVPSQRLTGGN